MITFLSVSILLILFPFSLVPEGEERRYFTVVFSGPGVWQVLSKCEMEKMGTFRWFARQKTKQKTKSTKLTLGVIQIRCSF